MDPKTRKVSSVPDEIVAPFGSEKIKRIKRYPKITPITQGQFLPYRVRFYDIDSNQHVNNAMYFNWLMDVLGYEFLTKHEVTQVTIRFDREVAYGHLIESKSMKRQSMKPARLCRCKRSTRSRSVRILTAKPSLLGEKNKTTLLPPLAEWQKGFCLVNSP